MIIDPQEFVSDIPDLHPLSNDYVDFWRETNRKIIEGNWLGGYYMPSGLHFYSNLGTILLNKPNSNAKVLSRPDLRDLEWYLQRAWTECLGFSGFEKDEEYSGNYLLLDPLYTDDRLKEKVPSVFNSKGEKKEFRKPRDLLESRHSYHKGRALFENPAYNLFMMGSRDTGKSYWVSQAVVLHKWLTNGATQVGQKVTNPVDITVGAAMSSYSNLLLGKTRSGLENLPGAKIVNGKLYPAPLFQHYVGSWVPGKDIIAAYDKKYPGGWQREGSKSIIRHRSFKDNSFADQGSRALAIILEEVGMFPNLLQVYADTKDNLRDGLRKIGSLVMLGTGGNMESGTIDASTMFYEPEAYDILPFDDIWENNGSIGLFIPAYMALNEYKDKRGFSDVEAATKALKDARDKIKYGSGGSSALNKEMQYRPIVPSEMFLTKSSNIFPVPELRRRLSELQTGGIYELLEKKVELYFDPTSPFNGVNYRIDPNLQAINTWPWKEDSTEGAVVIYELPHLIDGSVPRDAYIISCDPFRDNTADGESFAAIYVMKTSKYPTTVGHNEIVATYIGRPYLGVNAVNEILYKLSLFYGNATIYFENAVGNVKDYFEKINRLDLLASQPVNVLNKKASFNTRESVIYGYPMSNEKIKWEALQYYRSWLLEEREQGKRNLDLIPDKFLIQQTIAFTMKGNFDGVMGVLGCIIGLQEIYVASKKREEVNSSRSKLDEDITQLLKHNKRLFINEQFSETEALLFRENQRQL